MVEGGLEGGLEEGEGGLERVRARWRIRGG